VTLGVGFTARLDERLNLFADYTYAPHTGNETSHTASAGLKVNF